jgi:dolichyl-phosphate-mannose--protein O-mannosyl transferase
VFGLLIQLGASDWGALVGALAIALDNALLIQTRILALDGVLLAATLGALSAYLAALGARSPVGRRAWTLVAGALVGLAVGTKFTGLVRSPWSACAASPRGCAIGAHRCCAC